MRRVVVAGAVALILLVFSAGAGNAQSDGAASVITDGAAATPPTPQHTGRTLGPQMLAAVALPASAEPYAGMLPKVLAAPTTWFDVEHLVDVHREWTVVAVGRVPNP